MATPRKTRQRRKRKKKTVIIIVIIIFGCSSVLFAIRCNSLVCVFSLDQLLFCSPGPPGQ